MIDVPTTNIKPLNKTPLDLTNKLPKTRIILNDPKSHKLGSSDYKAMTMNTISANRMSLQAQNDIKHQGQNTSIEILNSDEDLPFTNGQTTQKTTPTPIKDNRVFS